MRSSGRAPLLLTIALLVGLPARSAAQVPFEGEVRQLVTFRFLPGRSADALAVYREQALPLYRDDTAMRSFRGFREVESPIPLDLIVVSSFEGMSGMDESNEALRALASRAGTSIGAIYGGIAAFSESHHDQFLEMLPSVTNGDPSEERLVAFVWYQVLPGEANGFERTLEDRIVPWEREQGVPTSTGRFLVSDGWHYLRILGFDSLGEYHAYWSRMRDSAGRRYLDGITARRREAILAPVRELAVR